MSQRESGVRITIFPMVHVGEQAFYDRVHSEALAHDAVLFEGVRSRQTRLLTASYRWLDFARLGLVVQPAIQDYVKDTTHARLAHADISSEEVEVLWRRMPFWLRAVVGIGAPIYGLVSKLTATRESIAKGMSQDMLRDPKDILEDGDEFQPLRDLVDTARDARLVECLDEELGKANSTTRLALIYGAGHISEVLRALSERGFVPTQSDWITIFSFE
ncbi:hypothetical protein ACRAQ7_00200 [Erythrobacter sp. W53]|uniref:hypothetical protein n=1 Tax=Erythrobacter sp. W53 TaxID=3425947 RepID=UPI003D768CA1